MLPQTELDTINYYAEAELKHYLGFLFSTFCHFVPFKMFNHSSALGMQIRFAILSIDLQTWTKDQKHKIASIKGTVLSTLILVLLLLFFKFKIHELTKQKDPPIFDPDNMENLLLGCTNVLSIE